MAQTCRKISNNCYKNIHKYLSYSFQPEGFASTIVQKLRTPVDILKEMLESTMIPAFWRYHAANEHYITSQKGFTTLALPDISLQPRNPPPKLPVFEHDRFVMNELKRIVTLIFWFPIPESVNISNLSSPTPLQISTMKPRNFYILPELPNYVQHCTLPDIQLLPPT